MCTDIDFSTPTYKKEMDKCIVERYLSGKCVELIGASIDKCRCGVRLHSLHNRMTDKYYYGLNLVQSTDTETLCLSL